MQENERKEQQAQDISEEMISQENISQEIGEEEPAEDTQEQGLLNITFIPKYMDILTDCARPIRRMVPEAGKNALCGACAADVCTVGWIFLYTKRLYVCVCTAAGRCRTVY